MRVRAGPSLAVPHCGGRLTHDSSLRMVRGCVKKATASKATPPAFPAPYAPPGSIPPGFCSLTPAERTRGVGESAERSGGVIQPPREVTARHREARAPGRLTRRCLCVSDWVCHQDGEFRDWGAPVVMSPTSLFQKYKDFCSAGARGYRDTTPTPTS